MGGTAPMSEQEAVCNAMDLFSAGHETTTGLIGNGLWLLLEHPEQWKAVKDDPSLLPGAHRRDPSQGAARARFLPPG